MSLGYTRDLLTVQPDIIFSVGGFPISNSALFSMFIALMFVVFGLVFVSGFKKIPTRFQSYIEMIYEAIVDLITQITQDRILAKKLLPFVGSILIYFVVANLIGIIPGLTSITYNDLPIFRTPTTDINGIIGVSLAVIIGINYAAFRKLGLSKFLGMYFPVKNIITGFKKSILDGAVALVELFVGILGIVGELAKVISLTFRLFGNMFAGAILTTMIVGAFAWGFPAIWGLMNGFTSILQGIVYAILVTVYYTLAVPSSAETSAEQTS